MEPEQLLDLAGKLPEPRQRADRHLRGNTRGAQPRQQRVHVLLRFGYLGIVWLPSCSMHPASGS
jgi:hypothetical protein